MRSKDEITLFRDCVTPHILCYTFRTKEGEFGTKERGDIYIGISGEVSGFLETDGRIVGCKSVSLSDESRPQETRFVRCAQNEVISLLTEPRVQFRYFAQFLISFLSRPFFFFLRLPYRCDARKNSIFDVSMWERA